MNKKIFFGLLTFSLFLMSIFAGVVEAQDLFKDLGSGFESVLNYLFQTSFNVGEFSGSLGYFLIVFALFYSIKILHL